MKRILMMILFAALLTGTVQAAELPRDLRESLPEEAEELLETVDPSAIDGFSTGVQTILSTLTSQVPAVLEQRLRGSVSVLLVVILCSLVSGTGGMTDCILPMAGACAITALTAGSLDSLIGLGVKTIEDLQRFSKVLLPTLAAATAASGAMTTATLQQVTTVFLVDLLLNLMDGLLMPLMYLYIGVLTASACLPKNHLVGIAEGLKKLITWILTTVLLCFTLYLSVARVISGGVDAATVRIAKTTISGVVPVVGGIIAEVSETVLAGAGVLKNTIGIFGMLGVLAACAHPFLQLGVQYLLYKLTAFFASVMGAPELCKLIDGLGGAFGLVLGMTGACALLLLVSVLSCVAAVIP